MSSSGRYIVVGVTGKQPEMVVRQAARFARQFDVVLVCANVDPASNVVSEHPDGSVESRPIDPDLLDWNTVVFDAGLAAWIRAVAGEEHVQVIFRALAGDVGHALGRLAEVLDAQMIVVGSRHGGFKIGVHDFFAGSVAVHLIHDQPRPVVVIPLSPAPPGITLPWKGHHR